MQKKMNALLIILLLIGKLLYADNKDVKDSIRANEAYREAIVFFQDARYPEAIRLFNTALHINIEHFGEKSFKAGALYNALGITYKNMGNYKRSIEYFLLAEKSYLASSETSELAVARLYSNTGNAYKGALDYGTALEFYQRAAHIFLNQKEIDMQGIADIYYSISNMHYELGNYEKVLQIIAEYQSKADPGTRLYFLSLKASTLHELNRNDEAYLVYRETIRFARDYYDETSLDLAFEYLNFARFLIYINNFKEAETVLENAEAIFEAKNIHEGEMLGFYFKNKGIYFENLNVESKDIETFREQKTANLLKSIHFYKKGLDALHFRNSDLNNPETETSAFVSLSQTLEFLKLIADKYVEMAGLFREGAGENYNDPLFKALEYYKATSNLIQKARREIYADESKILLSTLEEATFYKIIETAHKAWESTRDRQVAELAFTNAERIKASSVYDKITDQMAKENSLIPDSLTQLEKNLNFRITSYQEKRYNLSQTEHPDQQELRGIDSVLFQLRKERKELNHYLEENYSDFYELKYSCAPAGMAEISHNLRDDEVILEYILNENDSVPGLFIFFISSDSSRFIKQPVDTGFIRSVEKTFRFMSDPDFLFTRNKEAKAYCIAAYHLYNKLIQPFAHLIENKKITIIPDGKLNYLSFEGLMTALPDTSSRIYFNQLPYLIRNHTINYAYSANLHFQSNTPEQKTRNRVLAFAPEYKQDTVFFKDQVLTLVPLPGIQREVDLISKEVNTTLFKGDEASEKNFREQMHDYDILHLAMHAFINDSLPAFSRFAFTQKGEIPHPENDGWLNTADIYNMDLNARLAVLSACNTGSGNLRKGEGVMSLARGFLYAGCPSVVMTQWEVEDNAGTTIMSAFYQNLKKGESTDDALRQAKLQYLERANPRTAHPHYWLGYVSIGQSDPLFRSHDIYFFGLLILVLLGIAIDQLIRIKKKHQSEKHG